MRNFFICICILLYFLFPKIPHSQTFCYGNKGMCVDSSNVSMDRNIVMGDNTTSYNLTVNDAGTIIMKDDGGDTSITIGPVTDGTTTLGMTGSISASGDITANQFHGSGATLTDIPSSGMGNGDHGDFTYNGGNATLDNDVISIDEMADSDHGDFTYSGGSATLDTGVVADNEIDYSAVTLDDFDYQTANTVFYGNSDGDVTELAFGASGTYLKSQGDGSALTWDTPEGGGSAYCLEASDGDPNDALCADASGNLTSAAVAIDFGVATSLEIPNNNGDVIADAGGEIFYDEAEDQWVFYDSQGGELSGEEVADTAIKHISASWDPGDRYDRDQDIFLFTVGDDFPSGMIIDEWQFSCNKAPGSELDADLFYADDWLTLANFTIIDALDTSSGISNEDTDSNINGGSAIANSKKIGIRMNLDPEDPNCNQVIFELWGHAID